MSLYDHLREFRYRFVVSTAAVVILMVAAFFFYGPLLDVVQWPWLAAKASLEASRPELAPLLTNKGITGPFMLQLRICLTAGLIASCPVWLYHIWMFLLPAMLPNEKRLAVRFLAAAVPLFLFGVAMGYMIMPVGIQAMLMFTPPGMTNWIEMNDFLQFELFLLIAFGFSFLLPVVIVALNMVGVVSFQQLKRFRSYAIFGCFVIGAIATPGGDPFSMMALSLPMVVLYLIAESICRVNDKRKAARSSTEVATQT